VKSINFPPTYSYIDAARELKHNSLSSAAWAEIQLSPIMERLALIWSVRWWPQTCTIKRRYKTMECL